MSELLFENPFLLGTVVVVVCAIAWFAWVQSGNFWARNIAIALTCVGAFLIWLNLSTQTDREKVEALVVVAASELQNNEFDKIKARIHPNASAAVKSAVALLSHAKFEEARVTKIHSIETGTLEGVKTAVVRMNVFVDFHVQAMGGKTPRWVRVTFEERNGQWEILDFEHDDPLHELVGNE